MAGEITRLYPLPSREIPADAIYLDLELPPADQRDASRPHVLINMISSLDGKAAVGGKASPLGTEIDRQAMRNLRSKADAVMIGAGTLRAEKLALGLNEPARASQPLAVILTESGDVPLARNLILGEGQGLVVLAPEGVSVPSARKRGGRVLSVRAGGAAGFLLGEALRMLKSKHAVDVLLVEGGPTLNHSLLAGNLVDELFLTLAPKLLGGTAQEAFTILAGSPLAAGETHLISAYLAADELFLRYGVCPKPYNTCEQRG